MKLAVVGGGPIGLFTAISLANEGHVVDLYELGEWPKDKACGQGLMPSGMKLLKSLGIHFKENQDCFPFKGINYKDGPHSLKGLLPRTGFGIERKVLSQKLYQKALEKKNINLFSNSPVSNIYQNKDNVHFSVKDQLVSYDYVFSCDGLNSPLRKALDNRRVRNGTWRLGAREHFDIAPWNDSVEVYWCKGIEAYVTPVSANRIEVAFLWFEDVNLPKMKLRDALFDCFPELQDKLDDQNSLNDFKGHGPFCHQAKTEKVGRVYFLGDAYCFLDGITGEGISLGFKGSKIITENFTKWSLLPRLKFKLLYLHYSLMVNFALLLSYRKRIRRLIFGFFKSFPKGFDFLLKINDL